MKFRQVSRSSLHSYPVSDDEDFVAHPNIATARAMTGLHEFDRSTSMLEGKMSTDVVKRIQNLLAWDKGGTEDKLIKELNNIKAVLSSTDVATNDQPVSTLLKALGAYMADAPSHSTRMILYRILVLFITHPMRENLAAHHIEQALTIFAHGLDEERDEKDKGSVGSISVSELVNFIYKMYDLPKRTIMAALHLLSSLLQKCKPNKKIASNEKVLMLLSDRLFHGTDVECQLELFKIMFRCVPKDLDKSGIVALTTKLGVDLFNVRSSNFAEDARTHVNLVNTTRPVNDPTRPMSMKISVVHYSNAGGELRLVHDFDDGDAWLDLNMSTVTCSWKDMLTDSRYESITQWSYDGQSDGVKFSFRSLGSQLPQTLQVLFTEPDLDRIVEQVFVAHKVQPKKPPKVSVIASSRPSQQISATPAPQEPAERRLDLLKRVRSPTPLPPPRPSEAAPEEVVELHDVQSRPLPHKVTVPDSNAIGRHYEQPPAPKSNLVEKEAEFRDRNENSDEWNKDGHGTNHFENQEDGSHGKAKIVEDVLPSQFQQTAKKRVERQYRKDKPRQQQQPQTQPPKTAQSKSPRNGPKTDQTPVSRNTRHEKSKELTPSKPTRIDKDDRNKPSKPTHVSDDEPRQKNTRGRPSLPPPPLPRIPVAFATKQPAAHNAKHRQSPAKNAGAHTTESPKKDKSEGKRSTDGIYEDEDNVADQDEYQPCHTRTRRKSGRTVAKRLPDNPDNDKNKKRLKPRYDNRDVDDYQEKEEDLEIVDNAMSDFDFGVTRQKKVSAPTKAQPGQQRKSRRRIVDESQGIDDDIQQDTLIHSTDEESDTSEFKLERPRQKNHQQQPKRKNPQQQQKQVGQPPQQKDDNDERIPDTFRPREPSLHDGSLEGGAEEGEGADGNDNGEAGPSIMNFAPTRRSTGLFAGLEHALESTMKLRREEVDALQDELIQDWTARIHSFVCEGLMVKKRLIDDISEILENEEKEIAARYSKKPRIDMEKFKTGSTKLMDTIANSQWQFDYRKLKRKSDTNNTRQTLFPHPHGIMMYSGLQSGTTTGGLGRGNARHTSRLDFGFRGDREDDSKDAVESGCKANDTSILYTRPSFLCSSYSSRTHRRLYSTTIASQAPCQNGNNSIEIVFIKPRHQLRLYASEAQVSSAEPPKRGLRALMKEYGPIAVGVYCVLAFIAFWTCFVSIRFFGIDEDKVQTVFDYIKKLLGMNVKSAQEKAAEALERAKEAQEREETKSGFRKFISSPAFTSFATTFLLAAAMTKLFLPLKLAITAFATPIVARRLRASGIDLGSSYRHAAKSATDKVKARVGKHD
ncbi:hypothetical protein SeLEV6574_g02429 [Synchytrium endobioticum]|uniref:DUF1279 domain-containing protein n=1 Tax=Synchytrium endobioticum TaxID=286115 RepID=A0A507D8L2_9FUNG|nr:hypothetical protein SeLEV6574_g02429 [Synchytrium endobioticum]